ncbi:MAG: hypothetical protein V4689_00495 [Verrucomicrobiota bacterium]
MNPSTLNTRILRFSRTLPLSIGLLAAAALPAHAVTPFIEAFNGTSLNAARWSLFEGDELAPSGGKLRFTDPKGGDDTNAAIVLRGIEPKYNESWEVIVEAVNTTQLDSWTYIGVAVLNAADMDDYMGLEIAAESGGNLILSDFGTNGEEAADVEKAISSSKASLRVTFSSVTKVITFWYRATSGDAWKKHATFSTNNKVGSMRRGNWQMSNASGKFRIALYAGSEGAAVPSGKMSLDNFQIRNLK